MSRETVTPTSPNISESESAPTHSVTSPARTSRRALLAAVLGGVGAAVAGSMATAQRVLGAGDDGAIIHVGEVLGDVRNPTQLRNYTNDLWVLQALNNQNGMGVWGKSVGGEGVVGQSTSGSGVEGLSSTGSSVKGIKSDATTGAPVMGENTNPANGYAAVYGLTNGTGPAVYGEGTAEGNGTSGVARGTGSGVYGQSDNGRGGRFKGKKAQIRLEPATTTTHPASGDAGDIYLDKSKRLWLCKGGTTWVKIVTS
jgi:hypothetical protein